MTEQEPFRIVVADPAWLFCDRLPGRSRGAEKQYRCMSTGNIMRFPLPPIADSALLLLWRVAAMPQEAIDVVRAWAFVPKAEIVWEKLTKRGKPWFGMGRYVRASHETCIVATRGRFKVSSRSVRSRFAAMVPTDEHGRYIHSAKPEAFFELIDDLVGDQGPRLELFARKRRDGWTQIGDQLEEVKP